VSMQYWPQNVRCAVDVRVFRYPAGKSKDEGA